MKILIVDDSVRMRKTIISMLTQKQCTVGRMEFIECEDGCSAMAAYETNHPDWVLMDIAMKTMNGLDASALIKKKFPESNIMIVTDYDDARFRAKAKYCGIEHYILKENLTHINDILTTRSKGSV